MNHIYSTVKIPYVIPPSDEDIKGGFPDGAVVERYVMIKQNIHTGKRQYIPIVQEKFVELGLSSFYLRPSIFTIVAEDSFAFLQYATVPEIHQLDRRFVAIYKVENNLLTFKSMTQNKYPEIFAEKKINTHITPLFSAIAYPFLAIYHSNIIHNIATGGNFKIDFKSMNYQLYNKEFYDKLMQGKEKFPIHNRCMFRKNNKLNIISNVEDSTYLHQYDIDNEGNLAFNKYINLSSKNIKSFAEGDIQYDATTDNLIYFSDDNKIRQIPSAFIMY